MPNIKCAQCNKTFYRRPSYIKRRDTLCCSTKCRSEYERSKTPEGDRVCENCGKQFRTNPAYVKRRPKNPPRFCTKSCFYEYLTKHKEEFRKNVVKHWKEMKVSVDKKGYLVCSAGKIHRLIMEEHIGRKLLPTEIVHHINGNPQDNEIENLVIMTQPEHSSLHTSERYKGHRVHTLCSGCKTPISKTMYYINTYYGGDTKRFKQVAMCRTCYHKSRRWLK